MTRFVAEKIALAHLIRKDLAYIAGALTGLPEEMKTRYAAAGKLCDDLGLFGYVPHIHGTDPVQHPDVTIDEVHDVDFLFAVVVARFHINFASPVALGNGIEAGWGEIYHVPLIWCQPTGHTLSRLPRGLLNVLCTVVYETEEGLYRQLEKIIEREFCHP